MTDNEIIKALECCRDNDNNLNMEKCFDVRPYDGACAGKFMQDVLSLVNRQKAEIERLRGSTIVSNIMESQRIKREAKAEAYKEFAERLKEQDGYDNHVFDDRASILVPKEYLKGRDEKIKEVWATIDNLVKEMVGKNNG